MHTIDEFLFGITNKQITYVKYSKARAWKPKTKQKRNLFLIGIFRFNKLHVLRVTNDSFIPGWQDLLTISNEGNVGGGGEVNIVIQSKNEPRKEYFLCVKLTDQTKNVEKLTFVLTLAAMKTDIFSSSVTRCFKRTEILMSKMKTNSIVVKS